MSELKVYRFLGQDEVWPDATLGSDYYLKSEADNVIAEKDKEIAELESDITDLRDDKKSTDAILDERNAEIAELKEERRWRKFSEEKPEHHQWILVYYDYEKYGCRISLRRWDDGCQYDVEFQKIYTYWIPLPKTPEETK